MDFVTMLSALKGASPWVAGATVLIGMMTLLLKFKKQASESKINEDRARQDSMMNVLEQSKDVADRNQNQMDKLHEREKSFMQGQIDEQKEQQRVQDERILKLEATVKELNESLKISEQARIDLLSIINDYKVDNESLRKRLDKLEKRNAK